MIQWMSWGKLSICRSSLGPGLKWGGNKVRWFLQVLGEAGGRNHFWLQHFQDMTKTPGPECYLMRWCIIKNLFAQNANVPWECTFPGNDDGGVKIALNGAFGEIWKHLRHWALFWCTFRALVGNWLKLQTALTDANLESALCQQGINSRKACVTKDFTFYFCVKLGIWTL